MNSIVIQPEVIKELADCVVDIIANKIDWSAIDWQKVAEKAVIRPTGKWNPITYRPMTEEEVKRVETYFGLPLDEKDKKCFSCPMPEHGQEILISTEWGVSKDICLYDCDEGYFLDGRGDWEDVDAWMPLPEKYDGADTRGDHHED